MIESQVENQRWQTSICNKLNSSMISTQNQGKLSDIESYNSYGINPLPTVIGNTNDIHISKEKLDKFCFNLMMNCVNVSMSFIINISLVKCENTEFLFCMFGNGDFMKPICFIEDDIEMNTMLYNDIIDIVPLSKRNEIIVKSIIELLHNIRIHKNEMHIKTNVIVICNDWLIKLLGDKKELTTLTNDCFKFIAPTKKFICTKQPVYQFMTFVYHYRSLNTSVSMLSVLSSLIRSNETMRMIVQSSFNSVCLREDSKGNCTFGTDLDKIEQEMNEKIDENVVITLSDDNKQRNNKFDLTLLDEHKKFIFKFLFKSSFFQGLRTLKEQISVFNDLPMLHQDVIQLYDEYTKRIHK